MLINRWFVVVCILGIGSTAAAQKTAGGKKTLLVLNVGPDPTDIYIDDKKRGTSDKLKELVVEPGNHIVRVVHNLDEHEDMVTLKKGQTVKFEWKFEDDRPKPAGSDDDDADDAPKQKDAAPKDKADAPPAKEKPDQPPTDDAK